MLLTLACPDPSCDAGQVIYEIDAGVEGDASLPYGTRTVYEGAYEDRDCGSVHPWSARDDAAAWDAACAAYRDDERE